MTESGAEVRQYVGENPGVHFSAIVQALDQASGQVQHHVYRLVREDELDRESLYGRTHYYPAGYDEWERGALALLRRETCRDVLVALLEADGRRPGRLAEEIGIARSTLEHHLGHLVERSLVEKRRDDRGRVTLHLTRPERTALLLAEVTPTLADRFVDRFVRLFDSLVEEV